MILEVTIDLVRLEEFSSSWTLLQGVERKHQMMVKDGVWGQGQRSFLFREL